MKKSKKDIENISSNGLARNKRNKDKSNEFEENSHSNLHTRKNQTPITLKSIFSRILQDITNISMSNFREDGSALDSLYESLPGIVYAKVRF